MAASCTHCHKPAYCRGMCAMHYRRWERGTLDDDAPNARRMTFNAEDEVTLEMMLHWITDGEALTTEEERLANAG